MITTIHMPFDLNNDRHCDVCGKFVDKNGFHNGPFPDQIINFFSDDSMDFSNASIDASNYNILLNREREALYNYCKNNIFDITSSPNINGYLRKTYSYSDSEEIILKKNISDIENALNYYDRGKLAIIIDKGFLSTSTSFNSAKKYFHQNFIKKDVAVLF